VHKRIPIDHPMAAICPNAPAHDWWGRPGGWRHASVARLWVVETPERFTLERHVGKEAYADRVMVDLDPGTRLRYDISDFYEDPNFGSPWVTYFFRVESGLHAGRCVRTVDTDMPVRAPDTEVTPARIGLRPAGIAEQDHQ
jgi:uncharacterized protein YndB with AHSA1/START domain